MPLTLYDVRGLTEAAANVEEISDEFKFLLPLFVTLIAAAAGAGAFYVKTQSGNLERAVKDELANKVREQTDRFAKSFNELEEKLTFDADLADAKLDFFGAGIRYRLALYAWRSQNYRDSVEQGEMALERADSAIRLFEELRKRKTAKPVELQSRLEYRCHMVGDVAYYRAEEYRRAARVEDGGRALELARRLRKDWGVFQEAPVNLVDNYLFVFAVVRQISPAERTEAVELRGRYNDRIIAQLEQDDPELAREHAELFDQFFGPV